MAIKIPVSAEFNSDDVKKQIAQVNAAIKQMGDAVAKANGTKFEPITLEGKEDLKYFVQQTEKLLKIQGELRNRMQRSGQEGKNPILANWNHLYLNESTRLRRQQEALVFLGMNFEETQAPGGGSGGASGGGRQPPRTPSPRTPAPPKPPVSPWVQQGTRILNSGLNAAGPVGGVASGALSTGMASGFGAGLMGLFGGIAALGVGKLVGSVMEKVDQANDNNVAYDRLKRTLGDVNVSFEGLKTLVQESGYNLAITFDEAGKLSSQFSKLANLSGDQYKQLMPELTTGVGFARSFGLDPSQAMGYFGTMRGLRVTGNDQDTRRMALLFGEAVGKSGAFAKADEVFDAITSYTTQQTRNSLTRANVAGYAGEFSALAGSGIPGLDPAGAGGMLARINASLAAGGAHGEASQFFSSMVANRMGLDPIQMAILREGGAFATTDQMFGAGSAAARYGIKGPGGSSTFLQETLGTLRSKYRDPGLLAMATANHLGIGMNQAMAILSVKPNQMGDLQRGLAESGVDMSSLNAAGISNLAKVYTGTASDRRAVADSLFRRTGDQALTTTEADRLRTAMAGSDVDAQKKILSELVSSRDQERTTGSDIRDSKNLLDNLKTAVADKLVPLMSEMRYGILSMAGVGKNGMTIGKLKEDVIRADFRDKAGQVTQEYASQISDLAKMSSDARMRTIGVPMGDEAKLPPAEQQKAVMARQQAAQKEMAGYDAEIARLQAERDKKLQAIQDEADAKVNSEVYGQSGTSAPVNWKPGVTPVSKISDIKDPLKQRRAQAFLEAISASEGANYDTVVGGGTFSDYSHHPNRVGTITADGKSTAAGRYQINFQTYQRAKQALGLNGFDPETQDRIALYLMRQNGALDDVLNGNTTAAVNKLGGIWQGLPSGRSPNQHKQSWAFFNSQYDQALKRNAPVQLPSADIDSRRDSQFSVSVSPLEVIHKNEKGEQVAPTQTLQTTVDPVRSWGQQ